tara:strand:+ start:880 stop:2067 length:1188 start_codon:yes stop_codon:yes gene_type:complete
MRSQLSFNRRVVYSLAVLLLVGHSVSLAVDKYTVSGEVIWPDKEKKKKPKIILKGDKSYDEKISKKGDFKIKRVVGGEYSLQVQVDKETVHEETITLIGDLSDLKISVAAATAETPAPEPEVVTSIAPVSSTPSQSTQGVVPVPKAAESSGGVSNDFILNELNFEIKKLTAEFKHLTREMDDLKALSKMWINPLTIYSKEIILKNGSTVFGKIVYQDDKSLKVETLVGYLIIKRDEVVRIVDNVITEDQQEYVPEQIRESYAPPPMPKLTVPKYTSSSVSDRDIGQKFSANCVLMGNISEKKDSQGNIVFNGEVKNIGGRRADFVKVDFVFRKNWSGETRTLTTFIVGSYNTFDSGIVSDASLLPGALGKFELYVPQDFGSFIGYSYVIDWEEYQ